jgi:multimeric flavodoxin WrbA
MNMKVLLVNGSPEKKGCVNRALEEIEKTFKEEGIDSEIFWIGNQPLGGCMSCDYCHEHGECVLKDKVNDFASLAESADGFIFGSPVYYAGMAGNMKAFMDRLFYSSGRYLRGKPAAGVISSRRGGSTSVWDEFNKYFGISQMYIVGSTYWNEVHGFTPEDVEKDLEGLQVMRYLARNMAYLLKCLDAGKKAGVVKTPGESRVATNFIR